MQNKRTIFIGDIHGCFDEFKLLIEKLELQKEDTVYLVGDMISKGPKSFETLQYIYENKGQFHCVLGNNEVNFLRYLERIYNKDLEEFGDLRNQLQDKQYLIEYLSNFPLYREEENFIVLHGGIIPGKKLENHIVDEITRLRKFDNKAWYEYYHGEKKVIYGHWAVDGLRIRKNTIGLDSGCVYGKMLSAYILETGELIQQQALNIYVNVYK